VSCRIIVCLFVSLATLATSPARAEILIGSAGPFTGKMSWFGEQHQRGVEAAVSEINAAGGILGESLKIVEADDYCDKEQAVAAANKLIADRVSVVVGHNCSGAAIPASKAYADAGLLMITGTATNPIITDQGFRQTFRMVARDTLQGEMAATYMAEHLADQRIAILNDGEGYGKGLAEATRAELNRRGVREVIYAQVTPGKADYSDTLAKLEAADVDVLFYGGYQPEAALLIRQARDRGYDLQLVGSDALVTEYFWRVAGPAAVGVRFVSMADPRINAAAAPVVAELRAEGYEPEGFTLYSYAAVEVWAQAVEKAGTVAIEAVADVLRTHRFDTVLGRIGFDEKGDVYGYEPFVWYVWQKGKYVPLESGAAKE
jgi:branched-chain amino acid transport system substrate-binding protein